VRSITSYIDIVTVKSVEQILECNNRLDILELTKDTLDLFSSNAAEFFTSQFEGFLPVEVGE